MTAAYETSLRELCGSNLRFQVLRALFQHPEQAFHVRGLAAALHTDPGNVHRLLTRLVAGGLCERQVSGQQIQYRARRDNPLFNELAAIFSRASALMADLRKVAQEHIDGTVAVFGSIAKAEDRPDSDIDILAITDTSQILVQAKFMPVSRKYRRDINAKAISEQSLIDELRAGSGFWKNVLSGPLVMLKGQVPNAVVGELDQGEREAVPQGGAGPSHHKELARRKRREAPKRARRKAAAGAARR